MEELDENSNTDLSSRKQGLSSERIVPTGNTDSDEALISGDNLLVEEARHAVVFFPTWRSQMGNIIAFVLLSFATVYLSNGPLSFMVLKGKLFPLGNDMLWLHFPVLIMIPAYFLMRVLVAVYDSKFIIDDRGVEAHLGLVSFNLRQPRLRYEDIRGVEPTQTLVERMLGIGTLLVGSAMTFEVEIVMEGIDNPRAMQELINRARDAYLKKIGSSSSDSGKDRARMRVTGD